VRYRPQCPANLSAPEKRNAQTRRRGVIQMAEHQWPWQRRADGLNNAALDPGKRRLCGRHGWLPMFVRH
jgi:hypothetical protein